MNNKESEKDIAFTVKAVAAFTLLGYACALFECLKENMSPEIKRKHEKFLKAVEDTQYKNERLKINSLL